MKICKKKKKKKTENWIKNKEKKHTQKKWKRND